MRIADQPDSQREAPAPPTDRPARRGAFLAGAGAATAALVLLAGVALVALAPAAPPAMTERDIEAAVDRVLDAQAPEPPLSQLVYQAILPSIALVRTDRAPSDLVDAEDEPTQGIGTAVVVTAEGDALTAFHVVEGSETIELTFADGSTSTASIVTARPEDDIAVLRPDVLPETVVPATLGNPRSLRVGSEAFVVGHPYGLIGSLSSGVVSGLERRFRRPGTDLELDGLIQIDAAVNPGNSGGPLLDRAGHVTGIVTALINPDGEGTFAGIGLAVPIDVAGGAAGLPPY